MKFKKLIAFMLTLCSLLPFTMFNTACGGLSDEQVAVIETAKAYLARGSRIQYADTRFTSSEFNDASFTKNEYRWESRGENGEYKKTPEDYTSKDIGYTNCADFTHDVYHSALNLDFKLDTTFELTDEAKKEDTKLGVFYYAIKGNETDEEKVKVEKEFRETLKPCDIVVVRASTNGHAMLYVGKEQGLPDNAEIIHSTGSVYNYTNKQEKFEENGTIQLRNLDYYFVKGDTGRYLFDKYNAISIIRPLNIFDGEIPQETKNRIKNLKDIVAEKLSTPSIGQTVSVGENVTFSFVLTNVSNEIKNVDVADKIPENTTFVSADTDFTHNNGELTAKITLQPNETKTISYTVTAGSGDYIHGLDGYVGGVPTNARKIYVKNTFNFTQQQSITNAIKSFVISNPSNLSDTEIINSVYSHAIGKSTKLTGNASDVIGEIYTRHSGKSYKLNQNGKYFTLIAPFEYGGRMVKTATNLFDGYRTRLIYPEHLITGDIIYIRESYIDTLYKTYMFADGKLYQIEGATVTEAPIDILETIISYDFFAVLRPSMDLPA